MILDERGKKYLLKEDCEFQSDLGIVTKEQIANCEIGDELKSHLDHTFKIVKPTVNDFIDLMDRRCSILVKSSMVPVGSRYRSEYIVRNDCREYKKRYWNCAGLHGFRFRRQSC